MASSIYETGKSIVNYPRGIVWGMMLALVACLALLPDFAYAQTVNCKNYVGLTNHIAGCIRNTLDATTATFFTQMYPMFKRSIGAVMTLSVIVFGIMGAYGMLEKVGRDSIMLALKLAMVSYFVMNSDYIYKTIISIMDSSATAVISYVPSSGPSDQTGGDLNKIKCLKQMTDANAAAGTGQKGIVAPWIAMDCMIDSVIGIKMDPKVGQTPTIPSLAKPFNDTLNGNEKGVSRGMLYLFFSAFQSSILGVILAIIGFIFIWGMINLIIKALFIYLAGYIGLSVLVIFTPLFVPMVLFQSTKSYFDKWVKLLISFALQPIIILVFITFSVTAVDLATFSGDYSLMYRIAGDESRKPNFSLNRYLITPRSPTNPTYYSPTGPYPANYKAIIDTKPLVYGRVKADSTEKVPTFTDVTDGIVKNLDQSKCTTALMAADPNLKKICDQSYPLQIMLKSLDFDQLAAARVPPVDINTATVKPGDKPLTAGEQIAREVTSAIIFAAIVVFVMNQLLKVIPMVAYDLIGDFGQSPNLAQAGGMMPGSDKIKAAMSDMVSKRGGG